MNGTTLPNLWAAALTAITTTVALLATQGLIDNRIEKLVSGLAAILIPFAYLIANSIHHAAHARVRAAEIHAGTPSNQPPMQRR